MEEDIIVTDENFRLASNRIKNYGNFLYQTLTEYEWILLQVSYHAIQDPMISRILGKLLENLPQIRQSIKSAADTIGQYSLSFVEEIDQADQFLYGKN